MKVSIKVNNNLTVHAEGESAKEVFKQISDAQETFEDSVCGACKSNDLKYVVRVVEDNEFYEILCKKCHHKLTFGHAKKGGKMYPKRYETDAKGKAVRNADGKPVVLGQWGWHKYVPEES